MPALPEELRRDLTEMPLSDFLSRWMFERVPHIFGADFASYIRWKHLLGDLLGVDPRATMLVGSSAVGTSLNPHKNFRSFNIDSDVDIAIVSAHHFDILWRWLRNLGSNYHALPSDGKAAVDEHRSSHLYWGVMATDKLLPHSPLAAKWVPALTQMSKVDPTRNRDIKARVYVDFDALRAYHLQGAQKARTKALGA